MYGIMYNVKCIMVHLYSEQFMISFTVGLFHAWHGKTESEMDLGPGAYLPHARVSWSARNEQQCSSVVPLVPPPRGGPIGLMQAVRPQRTTGEGRRGGM